MVLNISILGASGKMGQRIVKLAKEDTRFKIVCGSIRADEDPAYFSSTSNKLGIPLKTTPEEAMAGCQVAIDFSSIHVTKKHIESAQALNKGLVIGTTGLERDALTAIEQASREIPILYSPNFSLGIALCLEVIKKLARPLFGDCYIDFIETLHP